MTDTYNTRQQLFNNAWNGFKSQDWKLSKNNVESIIAPMGTCLYRGPNGTKCGIGWSIPDEKYNQKFEGVAVCYVQEDTTDPRLLTAKELTKAAGILDKDIGFAMNLQCVHDRCLEENLEKRMREFAQINKLTIPE